MIFRYLLEEEYALLHEQKKLNMQFNNCTTAMILSLHKSLSFKLQSTYSTELGRSCEKGKGLGS